MASDDVVKLEFPASIRARYGMYIGTADNANVIFREAIDNSVDELYAGKKGATPCDTIWIEYSNGFYMVADNCRGIPIKESPQQKGWTMTRLAVGALHAGSKFNKGTMAIGMNGVGISATNALSSEFQIMSRLNLHDLSLLPKNLKEKIPSEIKDSTYYYCKFEKGVLKEEGFKEYEYKNFGGQYPSTITMFSPDTSIFKSNRAQLPSSLNYVNYILKHQGRATHIYVNGKEYKDSLQSYGIDMNFTIDSKEENSLNPKLQFMITMGFTEKLEPCEIVGSVNGIDCGQGFHVRLFQNAFDRAFTETFSNCRRHEFMGMRMAIIAICNEPAFSSQTKERLADIDGFSSSREYELQEIGKEIKKIFKANRDKFKNHELKILEYLKSTEKIGRKEFIKSTVLIASNSARSDALVPEKLIDCSSTNRRDCELFLCEGNSAGGSLVKCRDPRIHAILPLRGKVLNTTGLEIERVLSNREMKDLISAIGVGVNDYHDMSEVRYGKVIIVADSDPDGLNIDALCLGALATHLTFLVEAGCVYVARSPLFKQSDKYYLDDSQLDRTKPFSRFKGLTN